jgi:SAM-dependent methyltransferase
MEHREAVSRNLESWEERTPIHLRSLEYRDKIALLKARRSTLEHPTNTEIGDVAGKHVLHLQCHIGVDTLSLALLGANVTGLDFSPASLDAARALASELGIPARFVLGDAQTADETLRGERFDLVFATFGVFCWIPNLARWMTSAANLLDSGGVLYALDGHPVLDVFEDDPRMEYGIDFKYSYFDHDGLVCDPSPSYADDGSGTLVSGTVQYTHTLGELVTSIANAGLIVEYLHEFPRSFCRRFESMIERHGTWDLPPPLEGKLPMHYSVRARKPAGPRRSCQTP